jgi:hypothetical protein
MNRYTPLGIATILNTKLVALTEGLVKFKTLIWNGSKRKAPETPPMDVKKDTTSATRGGIQGATSTPAVSKYINTSLNMVNY